MCELTIGQTGRSDYKEPLMDERYYLIPAPANITFDTVPSGHLSTAFECAITRAFNILLLVGTLHMQRGSPAKYHPEVLPSSAFPT